MYNDKKENEENFWISYADLMAGLLFVFILVIGAIIVKYMYTQSDLKTIKADLEEEKKALNLSESELLDKKNKLLVLNEKLDKSKEENIKLAFSLAKSQNMYDETISELQKAKDLEIQLNKVLENNEKELRLSLEQIEKISTILEDKEDNIVLLNKELETQQGIINSNLSKIKLNLEEIEKLKALLFEYEVKTKEEIEKNQVLNTKLNEKENFIKLKDEELLLLEKKLLEQSKAHQKLVEEFDITKVKIKHLTGIKINVIAKLREKLGSSINIDSKSGAIKFSSNILFGQGEYKIKESSKPELKAILKNYLSALLENEEIRKYIHNITIEGHTNSDGSYLSNLELSQQRALEVMKFLYASNIVDTTLLQKYITASGRSYSDRIFKDGVEDKDLSRRIEIKFVIKNEAAIKELQNFLDKK